MGLMASNDWFSPQKVKDITRLQEFVVNLKTSTKWHFECTHDHEVSSINLPREPEAKQNQHRTSLTVSKYLITTYGYFLTRAVSQARLWTQYLDSER
ncbi:unnamed protein product [Timema podura]|uniref:Uncharacterized protein n=1 Tax=Timema podura TaxID=61482 RepID=A0ABN7PGL8_TIMPD|nr:unnamed protein product [Timema podura]